VHTCWARAAADDFRLNGQVIIALEILEGGAARGEIAEDTARDPVLTDCLVALWNDYRWPEIFAAGDRIQLPPFEFVAPEAQHSVASSHVPVHELADGKLQVRVVVDEANTGNKEAALSLLSLKGGLEVPLHTHSSAELLFVISGTGMVTGNGKPQEVKPGSAIYIPAGTVHGFQHTGEDPGEVLQLYAPGGPEGRFKDPANTAGTTPFAGKLRRRGPRPHVGHVNSVWPLKILDGQAEVRILLDEAITGDKAAYLGALSAQPGAAVPAHRHADSSEFLFVIEGQAEMKVGGRTIPVQGGDGVQIPPGIEHGVRITGADKFKAIQFYTPAGPEQRFKAGAK
jgi:quercetin dioxygenase-like cupin family protein